MEEQPNPLVVTQLLQHTLRSFCIQDNSLWVYAVFWRILPRNYPPPKWDGGGGTYDKGRGSKRNWILAWEDGFCNFGASAMNLQPKLFFKMSHEIYNYGEGWIGKVAADESHKWIYRGEADDPEINFLSAWQSSVDPHPRTWEAQFRSGIKTLALIGVAEGVLQLGSLHEVIGDPNSVVEVRKRLSYIGSMLLPHPSFPYAPQPSLSPLLNMNSRSSLDVLLSKLPAVTPPPSRSLPPPFWTGNQGEEEGNPMPLYYDNNDDQNKSSSSSGYY